MPTTAPTRAITAASPNNKRRSRDAEQPTAAKTPTSAVRPSMPRRNNSAIKSTADAIRKKLKPRNKPSNEVVPPAACKPCSFMGSHVMPSWAGSTAVASSCRTRSKSVDVNRSALTVPQRVCHSCSASFSETNALGVVRCWSQ